jgi:hypothetical protein
LDYDVEVEQRLDQLIHVQPIFMSDYSHFLFKFLLFAFNGSLVDELHPLVVSLLFFILFVYVHFEVTILILVLLVRRRIWRVRQLAFFSLKFIEPSEPSVIFGFIRFNIWLIGVEQVV